MTVGSPWVLWATAVAVAGIVGAHLLSVGRPPVLALPTARFVPEGTLPSVSRARWPTDRRLLLLRVLALVALGLAFAGVQPAPSRVPVASVVVIDPGALADARWATVAREVFAAHAPVRALVPGAGAVRTHARSLPPALVDSLADSLADSLSVRGAGADAGSLAGALLAARRAAPSLARGADSLALVVITPLREDATTAALDAVRATWPGRVAVRALEPAPAAASGATPEVTVRATGDDVVAAALRGWSPAAAVRVVRDTVAADDSAFARAGGVLVDWREPDTGADSAPAVAANGVALVAAVGRGPTASPAGARHRAVAWFADGTTAVTERAFGDGCTRHVHFGAPAGDALLTAPARGLLAALVAPCGAGGTLAVPPPISRARLDDGPQALAPRALAPRAAFAAPRDAAPAWLTRALLAVALALLLAEQLLRARVRGAIAAGPSPRPSGGR